MDRGSADVKRGVTRAWLVVMASGAMMGGCGGDDGGVQATASETDPTEAASSSGSSTDPDPSTTVTDSGSSSSSGSTSGSSSSSGGSSESSTGTGSGSESGSGSSSGGAEGSSSGSGSSGSSSSGVAAESSSSGSDPSIGFIEDPDVPLQFECSPWEQDCPEGEKCMPWADDGGSNWNALRCSPLSPTPAGVGESCTVEGSGVSGIDDCDIAAMCWNVDTETNQGTCVAMCGGTPDAPTCAAGSTCTIANDGVLILCLPQCDPLLQDCDDGDECIANDDAFICAPDASRGLGAAGDPCEFLNVCDPGLMCNNTNFIPNCFGSSGCCTPFCDVGDPSANMDCASAVGIAAECVPFFAEGEAPMGFEDVGVCGVPA